MKSLVGKVTSTKMTGTVAVTVDTFKAHPVYKKRLRQSRRYLAAAAKEVKVGDLVTIREIRPVSRSVHFKVEYILSRSEILTDVKQATRDVAEVSIENQEALPAKAHTKDKEETVVEEKKAPKRAARAKKDVDEPSEDLKVSGQSPAPEKIEDKVKE